MIHEILEKLHENGNVVLLDGFRDYLLINFLTDNKYSVYNTSFREKDVDRIIIYSDKEAEIVLR